MEALFLTSVMLLTSTQQIAQKEYNKRAHGGSYTFVLISMIAACAVFLITSGGVFNFQAEVLLYAVLFALGYCTSMVMGFLAIQTGSLSLSALIMQYSMIVPAIYGMVMLNEPLKLTLFVGLILLIISLILVNLKGKEDYVRPTLKWAFFAGLSFIGNGFCVTVQKVQQINFEGKYKSEFLIMSVAISVVIMLCLVLLFDRKAISHNIKSGGLIAAGSGICNGVSNFLVMVLTGILPASVMYPVISAGGTITSSLAALLIYREKMSPRQIVGLGIGILAIVALNL